MHAEIVTPIKSLSSNNNETELIGETKNVTTEENLSPWIKVTIFLVIF